MDWKMINCMRSSHSFCFSFVESNQPTWKTSHCPLSKLSLIPYDLFEALCTAQGRIWLIRTWMINRGANKEKTDPAMYDVQPKDDITSSRSPSRGNLYCIWMSFFQKVVCHHRRRHLATNVIWSCWPPSLEMGSSWLPILSSHLSS